MIDNDYTYSTMVGKEHLKWIADMHLVQFGSENSCIYYKESPLSKNQIYSFSV